MGAWNAISRDDLLTWANSVGAASQLPELVRRLVLETGDGIEAIDFPGGSGVTSGGFDGFVRAAYGTPFVPAGSSVWELSVKKSGAQKAEADYIKRNATPDGSPVSDVTYVQVICRPWSASAEFARIRSAEGKWREVRGYNVDRLATWIEQAPATRLWLLELIGRPVLGVWTGAEWWMRWAEATSPALTPDVVLARKAGLDDLRRGLQTAGVCTVSGPVGADELVACAVATAVAAGAELLARTVVVEDRSVWMRLVKEPHPLTLVAARPSLGADVESPTQHALIIPVPQSDSGDVVLDLVDGDSLLQALRVVDETASYELGTLARRSVVALRRRLARRQELMTPPWATGSTPRSVRAALLLTSWDDRNQADRDVVAAMSGVSYEQAREELLALTETDDPFVALTDHQWHVVSPVDAWRLLARRLLADDLAAFVDQAGHVLGERDPALTMSREDRWRASIDGKVLTHSTSLRRGIAAGLALVGTYGDLVTSTTGLDGERWTSRAIRPLLDAANTDRSGVLWASMSDLLPRLIEAAPRDIFEALSAGTTGNNPVLALMFQDDPNESSIFGGGSPHTSFLWALERTAWSSELLSTAAELLAALASLDPGGRYSNRPDASLANIFCPWHPDTAADVDQRLAVIDRLRSRRPDVAWRLMLSMLPSSMNTIHHPCNEPDFRDWKPVKTAVLRVDYWRLIENVLARILEDAQVDARRWVAVVGAHQGLPPELRAKVHDTLTGLSADDLDRDGRRQLWESVRAAIAHHSEYSDAKWAMPAEELATLSTLADQLQPNQPADRHAWLFAEDWIELGDLHRRDDFNAYDAEVAARRAAAVKEIVETSGIEELARFASTVRAGQVGIGLASAFDDDYVELMVDWLRGDDTQRTLAESYFWNRCRVAGITWAESVLARHADLDARAKARLLLNVDDFRAGWTASSSRGPDVEREFWLNFVYFGRGGDFADVLVVAKQLGDVGRWAAALDMLGLYAREDAVSEEYARAMADALDGLLDASAADAEMRVLSHHDFERLFRVLDEHVDVLGLERVTRQQWYLLPALGYEPPTTTLHRQLAADPSFFVQMISFAYRRRGDVVAGLPRDADTDEQVAENAHRLLDTWSVPPGLDADGSFDVTRCEAWIEEATRLLEEADRRAVGRQHIGQILTYAPSDTWPSEDVAALIDRLDDRHIHEGVVLKIHNRRGVTSRGVSEGGDQEWELAADYQARAATWRDKYPRVGRTLEDVAESFERQARSHDAEAERVRRGLDR